jgi:hypothetical protein
MAMVEVGPVCLEVVLVQYTMPQWLAGLEGEPVAI